MMKFSEKGQLSLDPTNQLSGVDFRDHLQKEQGSTMFELASEFGLNERDVQKLKKKLGGR
ncbi:hypothetical protein JNUCC23_15665 [Peribacillus sp. JNUCC 23]|uniref:hypothetical protein n=1 Tax=Peribacillus sp. NPDC096379 TaxID=3364393 RepID=UPI00380A350E